MRGGGDGITIRIEVQPDCRIEVMRSRRQGSKFLHYTHLDSAMRVIRFFLKAELERAEKDRFIPQLHKEAAKAFKQIAERSPYNGK